MTKKKFNIYEDWQVKKWETSLSDLKDLLLERLTDVKEGLSIEFSDRDHKKYIISFPPFCCYRSINESFRNSLWRKLKLTGQLSTLGNCWIAENSDFLEILSEDPVWLSQNAGAKHYLLATSEDVIEIISSTEPCISIKP
jgi:hypothetical protein